MLQKIFVLVLLMMLPAGAVAQQQNPQLLFDQANQKLQNGRIVQALNTYQKLVKQNQLSGALFLNMGYSYLQLGKPGKAKYYFLKAKQFEETRAEARNGVKYIESHLSHQSLILPPLPWEQALHWLKINVGITLLLGIGLILLNAGVFMFIGSWFAKKRAAILPKIATGLATAGILVLLLSFYMDYRQQRYSKAVMVTRQAKVMKKPSKQAALVNKTYEGYSLTVDHKKSKETDNWIYVRLSNGKYGWIQEKEIMIL